MPFTNELRELEAVPPHHPFVSLYLGLHRDGEMAEAMRVFVRTRFREETVRAGSARAREHLETEARRLAAFLEDVIHGREERTSHGLAMFACAPQKLFRVLGCETAFENLLVVSDRAHLEPLRSAG